MTPSFAQSVTRMLHERTIMLAVTLADQLNDLGACTTDRMDGGFSFSLFQLSGRLVPEIATATGLLHTPGERDLGHEIGRVSAYLLLGEIAVLLETIGDASLSDEQRSRVRRALENQSALLASLGYDEDELSYDPNEDELGSEPFPIDVGQA